MGVKVLSHVNSPQRIAAETAAIGRLVLRRSRYVREANFRQIGPEDLELLFDLYDRAFFDGWMRQSLRVRRGRLTFRLAPRMTRVGGKTSLITYRDGRPPWFEIAIASRLLFLTFGDVQRPVVVCGLSCRDRLEALQRVMEHEIVHLVEMLAWGRSKCTGERFQTLAANIFGHRSRRHGLVTSREHAAVRHGLKPGDQAEFQYAGRRLTGRINRIHRRATILVPDPAGQRYTDGGTYSKYYVPLELLRPVEAP